MGFVYTIRALAKIFNGAYVLLLLSQSLLLPLSSFLILSLILGLSTLFIAANESVILGLQLFRVN